MIIDPLKQVMFDPAVKLFGKTIPLPEMLPSPPLHKSQILLDECSETTNLETGDSAEEELNMPNASSALVNNSKEDDAQSHSQETKAEVVDATLDKEDKLKTECDGQEKVLKKPDKIVPCPRCNSLETKFCYFNNYNVNQPRHFCKNCQRYWTAGGAMRNVPVGAGRRKSKHIASQYRQVIVLLDGTSTSQVDNFRSADRQVNTCAGLSASLGACNENGNVVKFGSDASSMADVLNHGDLKKNIETGDVVSGVNGDQPSLCGSSLSASICSKTEPPENMTQMKQQDMLGCGDGTVYPLQNPLQCYPGTPWVYPWNPNWNNIAAGGAGHCSSEMLYKMSGGDVKQFQRSSASMVVPPNFYSPSMPFPFVPASYWGCMASSWAAGAWNIPWKISDGNEAPLSFSSRSGCSSNDSPSLSKRCRDENIEGEGEDKTEKCIWVPKTLRIDDSDKASRSSIWDTLGIKSGQSEPILKGGIFKAFQPKREVIDKPSDATRVLQANPAALSRSHTFQEST